jgi:hypothetical protein
MNPRARARGLSPDEMDFVGRACRLAERRGLLLTFERASGRRLHLTMRHAYGTSAGATVAVLAGGGWAETETGGPWTPNDVVDKIMARLGRARK